VRLAVAGTRLFNVQTGGGVSEKSQEAEAERDSPPSSPMKSTPDIRHDARPAARPWWRAVALALTCAGALAACGGQASYGSAGLLKYTPAPSPSPSPSPTQA